MRPCSCGYRFKESPPVAQGHLLSLHERPQISENSRLKPRISKVTIYAIKALNKRSKPPALTIREFIRFKILGFAENHPLFVVAYEMTTNVLGRRVVLL